MKIEKHISIHLKNNMVTEPRRQETLEFIQCYEFSRIPNSV